MTKHLSIYIVAFTLLLAACGQLSGDVLTYRTADPSVSLAFKLLPPAPPIPTITPQVVPCIEVKANIDAQGRKLYHLPGMRNYNQVVISPEKGEAVYCSEQDAIDAGFVKAGN